VTGFTTSLEGAIVAPVGVGAMPTLAFHNAAAFDIVSDVRCSDSAD